MLLQSEECFPNANIAIGSVLGSKAIEQTAMSAALAVAKARLLSQHSWYLICDAVRGSDEPVGKR